MPRSDFVGSQPRPALCVTLFGEPRLSVAGVRVSLASRPRVIALLAFLLAHRGRPVGRDRIAFALWPDIAESAARAALRRHLNVLDAAIASAGAPSPIAREARELRIDPEIPLRVDVFAFEDASDDELEGAVGTYGIYLNGFDDDWIVTERERLATTYVQMLERLIERALARGEFDAALRWAATLRREDPYREQGARGAMRAHTGLGDRAAALAVFRDFRALLRRELDAEPMAATVSLRDEIADPLGAPGAHEFSDLAVRRAMLARAQARDRTGALRYYDDFARRLEEVGALPEAATASLAASLRDVDRLEAPWTARDVFPNNLPAFVTTLVGREDAFVAIAESISRGRLVTVTGAAGVGKTRTACATAERLLRVWHDGVVFVALADVASDADVLPRFARALGIRPTGGELLDAIVAEIRDRRMLLVVDNCEHVRAGAARCIEALLRRCAAPAVLATSRTLLGIEGERAFDLAPLEIPPEDRTPPEAEALTIPSVALFVARYAINDRRARDVRARLGDVLAIARHCDGLPLALELAASAGRYDDLRALLASLRTKGARGARAPGGRWESLPDAIDWSVRLLRERRRVLFERLSLFAGIFSLEAAASVSGESRVETARGLAELCDASLLVAEDVDPPLYRFLVPMREYARERLAVRSAEMETQRRFGAYAVRSALVLERDFGRLPTLDWVSRFERLAADCESVLELALSGVLDGSIAFELLPAMRGLWYATDPGRGLRWLERFAERSERDASATMRGRYLSTRAGMHGALGNTAAALADARAAVELLEGGDPHALSVAQRDLGDALGIAGDPRAKDAYERAERHFRAVDDRARLASTLTQLGIFAYNRNAADEARTRYEEARALAAEIGELRSFASATTGLGELEFSLDDPARAVVLATEAVAAFEKLRSDVGLCVTLLNRCGYQLALGELETARADFHAALEPLERTASSSWLALGAQMGAALATSLGETALAAQLLGFSAARIEALGIPREAVGEAQYRELRRRLRLDEETCDVRPAFDRGAGLDDAEAFVVARSIASGSKTFDVSAV